LSTNKHFQESIIFDNEIGDQIKCPGRISRGRGMENLINSRYGNWITMEHTKTTFQESSAEANFSEGSSQITTLLSRNPLFFRMERMSGESKG